MKYIDNILSTISVITASAVAIYGISSWRREAKWKKRYELAEEVLTLIYEAEDAIRDLRHPFVHSDEGNVKMKEMQDHKEYPFNSLYILQERYDKHQDTFVKLRSIKYRFMAIYGKKHEKLFNDLNTLMQELFTAAQLLVTRYWPNQGEKDWDDNKLEFQKHLDEMHKYEDIIWRNFENDIFDNKTKTLIENFELVCVEIISRKRL